jgi:hypothetical protein
MAIAIRTTCGCVCGYKPSLPADDGAHRYRHPHGETQREAQARQAASRQVFLRRERMAVRLDPSVRPLAKALGGLVSEFQVEAPDH